MTMIEAFGLTVNPKTMKLTYDDLRMTKLLSRRMPTSMVAISVTCSSLSFGTSVPNLS